MSRRSEWHCRHCGALKSITLIDLGNMPVANDLIDPTGGSQSDPAFPLKVVVCKECRLAQTVDVKDAEEIFRSDYTYFSSASDEWVGRARRYVEQSAARFSLGSQSRHVEIASNDGYLLQFSKQIGIPALGIEPCLSVAQVAMAKGIETRVEFFSERLGEQLSQEGWGADLVTANNVFAHVPDINDFARGIYRLLKPEGVATIEAQHLLLLLQKTEFDTIYHEHFSYFSLFSAKRVFEAAGLRIFDLDRLPTHGGSLRYYVCRREASHAGAKVVQQVLDEELEYGIDRDETYLAWADRVEALREAFRDLLLRLKREGKSIVGYGAPAKASTLLNFCKIGPDVIDFTVDRAPSKQGRMIPGVRVPIHAPSALSVAKPDYIVILPWNLADEIVPWVADVTPASVQFITAIPWPTII